MNMNEELISIINERMRYLESKNLEERDRFLVARNKAKNELELQKLIDGLMPTVNEFYEIQYSLRKYEWLVNSCNSAYAAMVLCDTIENREIYRNAYLRLVSYQTKLFDKYANSNRKLSMKK